MSTENQTPQQLPLPAWWILWAGTTGGLVLMYGLLGGSSPRTTDELPEFLSDLFATPVLLSCVVRWLVLPRTPSRLKTFPIFIIGLALAEGTGLLGIFLGGTDRNTLVALAFVGLLQYAPVFVHRLEA